MMVERRKDPPVAPQTISLAAAAELAFHAATTGWEADEQTLNRVAGIIAWRVEVFECEAGESLDQVVRVTSHQIANGFFERGGSILRLNDGGRTLTNLCIRTDDLSLAILEVRASFKPE
jgi:hypothetical protein